MERSIKIARFGRNSRQSKKKTQKAKHVENGIPEHAAAPESGIVARLSWTCTWQNKHDKACGKVFLTWKGYQSHQDRCQHWLVFNFMGLPPEVRNRVYGLVIGPPIFFARGNQDDSTEDELHSRRGLLHLSIMGTCKQVYQESFRFLYDEVTIDIGGTAWCKWQQSARKTGGIITSSRARTVVANQEKAVAMGYGHFPDLEFGVRAAKWVKRWVIAIDMTQYEGDMIYPEANSPPQEIARYRGRPFEKREPGRLPYNMLRMIAFARFWEQMLRHGRKPGSIHIRMYHSSPGPLTPKSFIPHPDLQRTHVVEALDPLRSVRGAKRITFSSELRIKIGDQLLDYLRKVMKTTKALSPWEHSQQMLESLDSLASSFHPHEETWADYTDSVLCWLNELYMPQGSMQNLDLLDCLIQDKQSWANIFPVYWRVFWACLNKAWRVAKADEELRAEGTRRNDELVNVMNAFLGWGMNVQHFPLLSASDWAEIEEKRSHTFPNLYEWISELNKIIAAPTGTPEHAQLYDAMRLRMHEQARQVLECAAWVKRDYEEFFENGVHDDDEADGEEDDQKDDEGEDENGKGGEGVAQLTDLERALDSLHY